MRKPAPWALVCFLTIQGAWSQAAAADVFSSAYADWPSTLLLQQAPALPAGRSAESDHGLTGRALLDELHERSGLGFRPQTYAAASNYLFSTADNLVVDGKNGVIDAYSEIFVPGRSSEGADYPEAGDENGDGFIDAGGMNVEHIWPQSFFSQRLPMKADLHNFLTTFIHPNAVRGNLPFGLVRGWSDYGNLAGAKRGPDAFEPPDSAKGRVARCLFYFYTRYNDRNITNSGYNDEAFWNGKIALLLDWNRRFPPEANERRRNDLVERFQGNRNPFIDDASLADRVGVEGFRRPSKAQRRLLRQLKGLPVWPRKP